MSSIEDDRSEAAQNRKRTHIDNQVVVSEADPPLRQRNASAAALPDFFHSMAHIGGCDELTLLDVDGPVVFSGGLGSCNQKIGLSAEERWNLQ